MQRSDLGGVGVVLAGSQFFHSIMEEEIHGGRSKPYSSKIKFLLLLLLLRFNGFGLFICSNDFLMQVQPVNSPKLPPKVLIKTHLH